VKLNRTTGLDAVNLDQERLRRDKVPFPSSNCAVVTKDGLRWASWCTNPGCKAFRTSVCCSRLLLLGRTHGLLTRVPWWESVARSQRLRVPAKPAMQTVEFQLCPYSGQVLGCGAGMTMCFPLSDGILTYLGVFFTSIHTALAHYQAAQGTNIWVCRPGSRPCPHPCERR
jgi:hypothetical protein